MRNSLKKLLSVIVCVLCFSQLSFVFADEPDEKVTGSYCSGYEGIDTDATHGGLIYVAGTDYVMNQSTSSLITPTGTLVTSWPETSHESQQWDVWTLYKPGYEDSRIVVCTSNPNLSLNINRTTYAVNVVEVTGNYYRDCCFVNMANSMSTFRFKARPRKTGESERGLIAGSYKGAKFTWGNVFSASTLVR